ncbi:hypothetical protein ACFLU3_02115 [Chloroflexota bacterium]
MDEACNQGSLINNYRSLSPEHVCQTYGWNNWDAPWGSIESFVEWEKQTTDGVTCLYAVNEIPAGRSYIFRLIMDNAKNLKYGSLSADALIQEYSRMAIAIKFMKFSSGWEQFKFPKEPLPIDALQVLVPELCSSKPYFAYQCVLGHLYVGALSHIELLHRCEKNPEMGSILLEAFHIGNTPTDFAEQLEKLVNDGNILPDENQAFEETERIMRNRLNPLADNYKPILSDSHEVVKEGLGEGVAYWIQKPFEEIAVKGLDGRIGPSLKTIATRNVIDATRKEDRPFATQLRKTVREKQPSGPKERSDLLAEVKAKIPNYKKPPLSLDHAKTGESSSLGDFHPDEHAFENLDAIDRRVMLNQIIQKADLPERQRMVVDLKLKRVDDRDISLELKRVFGKSTSEGYVRKLYSDAKNNLRKIASEIPSDEREYILSLLPK